MTGVTIDHRRGHKVIEVDTRTCSYQGHKWKELGERGRNKIDNFLFLGATGRELRCPHYCSRCLAGEPIKIIYS